MSNEGLKEWEKEIDGKTIVIERPHVRAGRPRGRQSLTPNQELFAKLLCEVDPTTGKTMPAVQAYLKAYGSDVTLKSAYVLSQKAVNNPKVQNRVRQIKQAMENISHISKQRIIERLDRISQKAEDVRQYGAAIKALEIVAKMCGMMEEKKTVGGEFVFKWGTPVKKEEQIENATVEVVDVNAKEVTEEKE